jgi:hypothetical protein
LASVVHRLGRALTHAVHEVPGCMRALTGLYYLLLLAHCRSTRIRRSGRAAPSCTQQAAASSAATAPLWSTPRTSGMSPPCAHQAQTEAVPGWAAGCLCIRNNKSPAACRPCLAMLRLLHAVLNVRQQRYGKRCGLPDAEVLWSRSPAPHWVRGHTDITKWVGRCRQGGVCEFCVQQHQQ